jgi:hypothetical protein
MAGLQTSSYVNGTWTTRTVDANAILRHHQIQDAEQQKRDAEKERSVVSPVYGLLSKTLIPSPVVHWILPARLRDNTKNDIVFIGVCLAPSHFGHAVLYIFIPSFCRNTLRSPGVISRLTGHGDEKYCMSREESRFLSASTTLMRNVCS